MKLSYLYTQVIKFGVERDPRKNKAAITSYADTSILYGDLKKNIRKIIVGIDVETAELLLADRFRNERGLDLVISHHPEGKAYATLNEVMRLQIDLLKNIGIPEKTAQALLEERMREVQRKILPQNHTRPVDAARLLDLPFMCIHTPADNHAFWFIKKMMDVNKPKKVVDIVDILMRIPEYKEAASVCAGPRIVLGNPKRSVGRVFVEMTGGTEGPKEAYDKIYKCGVRTIICMHLSEEHFKKVKDVNLNVVIAGHISSDTLGLNLLLDRIEKKAREKFQVTSFSGFNRISRN